MNDIMKKNVLIFSPIVLCVVMIIVLFTFIPLEWMLWGFVIVAIVYVIFTIIVWRHPRVRHYAKAETEFDKNYRYVKEMK